MKTFAIILAAGEGKRFSERKGGIVKKQFLHVGEQIPMWVKSTLSFQQHPNIDHILIVAPILEINRLKSDIHRYDLTKIISVIPGGERRQDSLLEAIQWIKQEVADGKQLCDFIFIHDGVRPFVSTALIERLWEKRDAGAVIPVIPISDTLKAVSGEWVNQTIDRTYVKRAQTPQLFSFSLMIKALEWLKKNPRTVTDDASIIEFTGGRVQVVEGESHNIKITIPEDLPKTSSISVGQGIDIHAFTKGNKIVLGGISIPYSKSLKGHSDADVLVHSLCNALLGAAGLSDIGTYFPDDDSSYKGISSLLLLEKVIDKIENGGYTIEHIDVTLVVEKPKLQSYIPEMKIRLSNLLKISKSQLAIKATTSEGIGFIGREEGICVLTVATLRKESWN